MPELPEVETILRGILPNIKGKVVQKIAIRQPHLRWQIPMQITQMEYQVITDVKRRGKYLLFFCVTGTAILHLGMSGSITLLTKANSPSKHDHFDILFEDLLLRYTDPRRFGALLWTKEDPYQHPLLAHLGPEPLEPDFNGQYLYERTRHRKVAIKQLLMNANIVVGIGNIYAVESLFLAKLHPLKPAETLTIGECQTLSAAVKRVLQQAIQSGGTTLRNFLDSSGKPGYFKQELWVYGRAGLNCNHCHTKLENQQLQNRATVFCPSCQR
jgi:formamidopyrimidine-DNA glycosylase